AFLRARVMDESRLQHRKRRGELLDGHLVLRKLGIARAEGLGDELARQLDQSGGAGNRRVDHQLTLVELLAAGVIAQGWIEEHGGHAASCPAGSSILIFPPRAEEDSTTPRPARPYGAGCALES